MTPQKLAEGGISITMIYTADVIDAAEADRIGLVNRVVPHEELMTAARTLAAKIAAGPPLASRLAKEGIRRRLGLPCEEFMHFRSQAFPFTAETADRVEASRAFLEKRAAVFKGE